MKMRPKWGCNVIKVSNIMQARKKSVGIQIINFKDTKKRRSKISNSRCAKVDCK